MNDTEKALNYYKTAALQSGKGPWPMPKYIPKRVLLPLTVRGDGRYANHFAPPGEYDAHVNRLGAVSVEIEGGEMLGVRLDEFEVIEWQDNPKAC